MGSLPFDLGTVKERRQYFFCSFMLCYTPTEHYAHDYVDERPIRVGGIPQYAISRSEWIINVVVVQIVADDSEKRSKSKIPG